MDEELQALLERYQDIESDLLKRINHLNPQPQYLPEIPLERLFYIKSLLSGGTSIGGDGGGTGGGDASAENQITQINRLTAIRDRISAGPVIDDRLANILGELQLKADKNETQAISGSVSVVNFPGAQTISGTVNVANFPESQQLELSGSVDIGNFPATQSVSGSVSVSNFPATQPVSGSVSVANFPTSFNIGNFPATQTISGAVSISNFPSSQAISGTVSISNFPTTQAISVASLPLPANASQDRVTAIAPFSARLTDGTNFYRPTTPSDTQPISVVSLPLPSGAATDLVVAAVRDRLPSVLVNNRLAVDVGNFPTTQSISGSVSIANFPSSQEVFGTVSVGNFPATQTISGSVSIANFPSSQQVSVSNFPATQAISAANLPLPTGASQEHTTAASPSSARLSDGTSFYKPTTPSDTQPISAASLPLPSGAATAARQDTGNTNLASIDSKIPASPSQDRVTAIAPFSARLTDGTSFYRPTTPSDTQPVSGTVAVNNFPTTQAIAGNTAAGVADSGNPLKIGGVYKAAPPTRTDGQRGDIRISTKEELIIAFEDLVSSTFNISAADVGSTSATGADNQSILSGTPTANSFAAINVTGDSSFAIQIDGAWSGTLQFERSLDNGLTYTAIGAFAAGTAYTRMTTTLNGRWHGNCSSSNAIRVRAIAWTSGTASIRLLAGAGTGTITVGNPIRLFDQVTGVQASIKGSGVAGLATDNAIVITGRFNQFAAEAQLTAIGITSALDTSLYSRITCQYTVANINTSVIVRLEGSNDGASFFNLSATNVDTTITANGTYAFILNSIALYRIRFRLVTITAGTPTVDVRFVAN